MQTFRQGFRNPFKGLHFFFGGGSGNYFDIDESR